MKIVIFADHPESLHLLKDEITKSPHVVMATVDRHEFLVHFILRTTPHIVVAHLTDPTETNERMISQVRLLFPELPLFLTRDDLATSREKWVPDLQKALAVPIRRHSPRPYAEESRYVLHDLAFEQFWQGKINRPEQKEDWEKICARQEARFVLQLQAGRNNHAEAKRYFECLVAQQTGLDQELVYRLAHGSYKALSWSRDLAAKWMGLLAHYVRDSELEYLPIPATPGPAIDFVHHTIPIEGMYAVTLVLLFGVKPSLANAIEELFSASFEGQDDRALLDLSLKLYGLAKFLEQVGRAQIEIMDRWLDPAIVHRLDGEDVPRGEERNAGILRDFYDLPFIVLSPEPLASILKGFHAGATRAEAPRRLPTFSEFQKMYASTAGSSSN